MRYLKSSLMNAAWKGHTEIVNLLLARGADLEVKDKRGMTGLMFAAWENHTDILKLLLEKGASVDARDENKWTAMMRAAVKGHTESMLMLLEKGADVNAASSEGDTALIRAAQGVQLPAHYNEDSVYLLIELDNDLTLFGGAPLATGEYTSLLR